MSKDYGRLWEDVTSTADEGKAVRILAEILVDKEGRSFVSDLEREDAELCIEILDRVSRDLHLLPSFAISDGFFRVSQSTNSRSSRSKLSSSL